MLSELTLPRFGERRGRALWRWHAYAQYAVAAAALLGILVLCAIILSKTFFLGSDSAHHYSHVWYISDQIFHHARLPLHVHTLESGDALTFPYAAAVWMAVAAPYALFGDWTVTATLVAGFALYGYAAVRARTALRDPRLLALIYVNTFLIEGLMSFQLAFIWACAFIFLFVEAIDKRRWVLAAAWAVLAVTTHPFAGGAACGAYALFAAVRRPRDVAPLGIVLAAVVLIVAPYAWYVYQTPSVETTRQDDLLGTLRWVLRYRGSIIALPLLLSMGAPLFRAAFLPLFALMALFFADRIQGQDVNTYGIDRVSRPFYGDFIASAQFDRELTYRVLEPNDREDGAYQLMRNGAVLGQEFFDQSQFRIWWHTLDRYTCFLGAKGIDVVLLEKDYPLKFSQNEDYRLRELEQQGGASVLYRDPKGRFVAYDVRDARPEGRTVEECDLYPEKPYPPPLS